VLVSVIIPALNEAENIQQAVTAARQDYTPDEVEIIVVDGGSEDSTLDMVPSDVSLIRSPPGRAVQMNRGAAASRGEILVFCHADSQLPVGWRKAVTQALSHPGVSGGTFQIRLWPARGILHLLNLPRYPANWRIMYGDQAQFMSRHTFEQVSGFPQIPLMEDLEMSRALHRAGQLVRIPLRIVSSSRRFLERGPLRQFCCMCDPLSLLRRDSRGDRLDLYLQPGEQFEPNPTRMEFAGSEQTPISTEN
jgi:rSAM/selenodomain-associated transferase 2